MCWGAVCPVTCALLPGQRLPRVLGTPNNVSLTGERRAGASASPSGGSSKHSHHGHKLDRGEEWEVCLCARRTRGREGKDRTVCVCVWGEGVCRCSLHVFLSATLKARKITLKLAHLPILLLLKTSPNFGNTQMLPLTSRFQLSAWLTASNLIRWKTLTTNRKRSAACFHGRPREAMPSR